MTNTYTESLATIEEILGVDAAPSLSDEEWITLAGGYDLEPEQELDFHDCF